jgi:hypothetical protein
MKRLSPAAVIAAFILVAQPISAQQSMHASYAPAPGTVVQNQNIKVGGGGQWRGVISKKAVGTGDGETFYQWYLSIYRIDGDTYHLRYQSPRNGGPLDKLEKAQGAQMWFPRQSAEIAGAAQLMGRGDEQLVVLSHQTGADCGSADLTVFRYDAASNKVVPAVTVENACDLTVKIVKEAGGTASLLLSGPYYNDSAPLCCPTKPKASATLKYANGKWVESPNYYKYFPNAFPHV